MSACLFMMPIEWFKKTSIEEIKEMFGVWEIVIKEYESNPSLSSSKFEQDKYAGARENYYTASNVILGYEKALKSTQD